MRTRSIPHLLPFAAALSLAPAAAAQCQDDLVWTTSGQEYDQFGESFDIADGLLAVGSAYHDAAGQDTGAVFLFRHGENGFEEVERLLPPTPYAHKFGWDVAVDGNRVLVGSNDDEFAFYGGAAFLFEETEAGWVHTDTLRHTFHAGQFSMSVSLHGDWAFASAPGIPSDPNHVYVFHDTGSGWVETQTLGPQGNVLGIGGRVAMSGDRFLLSARYATPDGEAVGVFVYELEGGLWVHKDTLIGSDSVFGDSFATAYALDGDRAVVAAREVELPNGALTGAVYVFERGESGWSQTAQVFEEDTNYWNKYAESLDLDGDTFAVGTRSTFVTTPSIVQAYRLSGDEWDLAFHEVISWSAAGLGFGNDIAVWGDSVLVSSEYGYGAMQITGRLYFFDLPGVTPTPYCSATPSSLGTAAELSIECPGIVDGRIPMRAAPVPNTPGIVFYGTSTAFVPFGDGFRCVGGNVYRLEPTVGQGNVLTYDVALDATSTSPGALVPGSTWYFQAHYRDGASSNLSSALQVTLAP